MASDSHTVPARFKVLARPATNVPMTMGPVRVCASASPTNAGAHHATHPHPRPAALLVAPAGASALTVSKAELKGGQLVLEGTKAAPGSFVTVESTSGAAGSRADTSGRFKVTAPGFAAPDCTVVVSDRQTPT